MKSSKIFLSLLTISCFWLISETNAQPVISRNVLANGGATSQDGSFRLTGTVGQAVIGVAQNSAHLQSIGFWYQSAGFVTRVEEISSTLPTEFELHQNYPNPFNPSTTIRFSLPQDAEVTLTVYDILGRRFRFLEKVTFKAGVYSVVWEARDHRDRQVASSIYFYRLEASTLHGSTVFTDTRKMILLR